MTDLFGTSGVRGPVGDEVTADLALAIGRAVAAEGAESVVVGRDARESGALLGDALTAGLRECGADVTDLGLAATPTIARAVEWTDADAGVAVTASHNPPPDNGLKLWTEEGQAYPPDRLERIERHVRDGDHRFADWDALGTLTRRDDAADRHVEALCAAVDDVAPLSVVVDVGNGVGGVTADALYRLGCHVETLNAHPDGRFPGRPSEPTAETLTSLATLVADSDADFGVAHDGDADRMVAVTGDGAVVAGDVTLALFARDAARASSVENPTVAAPVNTSLAVDDALSAVGASLVRTRVGDGFVAAEAARAGVVFGGEPSGAWIWPDETRCPDGPLAACRLAELVSRGEALSALVATVDTYPLRRESVEVRAKEAVVDHVRRQVTERFDDDAVSTVDGLRVALPDGWFLVRASGTQPLVRVTAEAREDARLDDVYATARDLVDEAVSAAEAPT